MLEYMANWREQLEDHLSAEFQALGSIHVTHAAGPKAFDNAIMRDDSIHGRKARSTGADLSEQ